MPKKTLPPEQLAAKKALALTVIDRLRAEYPDAACTLDYDHAWQLLVSVRLAAQCTDARVNVVVEDLVCPLSQCRSTGRCRTRRDRSHCTPLRTGPLQGTGYLGLYADAAGRIRRQSAHHL